MTAEVEKLQKQVDGLIQVLFSLAHDLARVEADSDLTVTLQGVGVNLKQLLVTLNDGKEPTVETAVPISNQGHDPR